MLKPVSEFGQCKAIITGLECGLGLLAHFEVRPTGLPCR
jgi:hypothetical protein